MDRSWVRLRRSSIEYMEGLNRFLDMAFESEGSRNEAIRCPCKNCYNMTWHNRAQVYEHLIVCGWDKHYIDGPWTDHGENFGTFGNLASSSNPPEQSEMHDLLHDLYRPENLDSEAAMAYNFPISHPVNQSPEVRFHELLAEADKDLYTGCTKYKKLEFLLKLYQEKVVSGWSNKSFSNLLKLLKSSYPEGETLPKNFYEMKKLMEKFGLSYEKIHACPNDCMLYWKDTIHLNVCFHCGKSRWANERKKTPAKVFRYFPLIPRLKRLYMSRHTAEHMWWHDKLRTKDGVLRHPADSPTWKNLDERYPHFASEPRNVRLGLASDGFNPFGNMSNAYSIWPVILTVYNLPPWMCMKQPYMIMSSVISGPKGPGMDIDVYLQPLVDELKEVWDTGVLTYDASTNETFTMRAALMWTINDYPAYALLSGWSTKGKYACPNCGVNTKSKWLLKGKKFCYMGHRRFLPLNHRYRRQSSEKTFSGQAELLPPPLFVDGSICLDQLKQLTFSVGKGSRSSKIRKRNKQPWKKKSIFFSLPYWQHHLVRHNLDVMHIEKNVCDSAVGTLLNIKGKTKDGLQAREDLRLMKIKTHLHRVIEGERQKLPPASFTLSSEKKKIFCDVLSNIKVPDGYASNLARCVDSNTCKISGWKSHDYHVVMQQLLPLAMRHVLPAHVMKCLSGLSLFFTTLCSKTSTQESFRQLSSEIALILCEMEKIFPPAFFDVMVHLLVHLAHEASLAGPVQYRWMYPIERFLHTLKGYVRNKSRPEGSIAEGYLVQESLSFCSNYFQDINGKQSGHGRNTYPTRCHVDGGLPIFNVAGRALGKVDHLRFETSLWLKARFYVLCNCPEVKPFLDEHLFFLENEYVGEPLFNLEKMQQKTFPLWFENKVNEMMNSNQDSVSEDLLRLSKGPDKCGKFYKKYAINGFKFRTKDADKTSVTQNCGVFLSAETSCYSRVRDTNPVQASVNYFGILTNVIELDYRNGRSVVLFDCDWVDGLVENRGVKIDAFGIPFINFKKMQQTDDTLILAAHALQVFYVPDPINKDWHMTVKMHPRDLYDVDGVEEDEE